MIFHEEVSEPYPAVGDVVTTQDSSQPQDQIPTFHTNCPHPLVPNEEIPLELIHAVQPINPQETPSTDDVQEDIHRDDPTTSEETNDLNYASPTPTTIQTPKPTSQRHRHSPYPLRVREPKRQWDESLQCAEEAFEPRDFNEAMSSADGHLWRKAAQEEYDSLIRNETWSLVPLPSNRKAIKSRWVFKVKPALRGSDARHKARLVAKGFSQRRGIDYDETFAPVAKQDTLRVILSFVATLDLELYQLDIKTAFLYGELSEEIYLEQPEGFVALGQEQLYCRLHKCLYGLKQASRVWNRHFDHFLKKFGLIPCQSDPCLYLKQRGEEFMMVVIWVDDGLICLNNLDSITEMVAYLSKNFEMRSSEANHFVGLTITRDRKEKKLYVSQPDYTRKILQRFHMNDCHPVSLPISPGTHLSRPTEELSNLRIPFKEAIGSLMYLMISTRPDIAFSVNQVSQFSENPQPDHWKAVKQILSYLNGTLEYGILFGPNLTSISGYTDSDYAGNIHTRRSTSGFIFMLNGGPVAWSSRRQKCVSLSTTEAEFVAACEAAKECTWLRRLLIEITRKLTLSIPLYCDNMSAIELIMDPKFHNKTKHIDVRYNFIRSQQQSKEIDVKYVPTSKQLADPFTKALSNPRFSEMRSAIGMSSVPAI